jgi:Stress responsive A/B Barrel Domain
MIQDQEGCCSLERWGMMSLWILIPVVGVGLLTVLLNPNSATLANNAETKHLRHVVQFKFKESSSKAEVQTVVDAFRALPSKISAVADFEYGSDNSPEGLADGFTHCFLLTFKSEADRDIYLKHTDHMGFVDVLKPHLDKVQVIDYWASK